METWKETKSVTVEVSWCKVVNLSLGNGTAQKKCGLFHDNNDFICSPTTQRVQEDRHFTPDTH